VQKYSGTGFAKNYIGIEVTFIWSESEKSSSVTNLTDFVPSDSPSFGANELIVHGLAAGLTMEALDLTGEAVLVFIFFRADGLLHQARIGRKRNIPLLIIM
jgi:hypothetical protein